MTEYKNLTICRVKGDPGTDPPIVRIRINRLEQLIQADTGRTVLGEADFDTIARQTGAKLRPSEMRITPYATTNMPTPQKLPIKGLAKIRMGALDGLQIETEIVVGHGKAEPLLRLYDSIQLRIVQISPRGGTRAMENT